MEIIHTFFCCGSSQQLSNADSRYEIKTIPYVRLEKPLDQKANSVGHIMENARIMSSEGDIFEMENHKEDLILGNIECSKRKGLTALRICPLTRQLKISTPKALAPKQLFQENDLETVEDLIDKDKKVKSKHKELYRSLDFLLKEAHTRIKRTIEPHSKKINKAALSKRSESTKIHFFSHKKKHKDRMLTEVHCTTSRAKIKSDIDKDSVADKFLVPSENSSFSFCPSVVSIELANKFKLDAKIVTALGKARNQNKESSQTSHSPRATADTPGSKIIYTNSTKSLHFGYDSPFSGFQV